MKPHEQRVFAEKAELDEKIARLDAFLGGDASHVLLTERQRQLLTEQRHYMSLYSKVLGVRISEFEPEPPPAEPDLGES
jgi:hypothetical protein